jgi:FAD/FMN-containing dehydrogenase
MTLEDGPLSWGRVTRPRHDRRKPTFRSEIPAALEAAKAAGSVLAYGLGRSYGDSCLNPGGALIETARLDRFIALDAQSGVLRAEAGVSFDAILRLVTPKGWFLPTTPGTRFVTLGGAVANDVHGKNHHGAGTFGTHVRRLGLRRGEELLEISPSEHPGLFSATVGGLGLTGLIEWVEIDLAPIRSTFLIQETLPFGRLDDFFVIAEDSASRFEHTVAWIDCTARGKGLGRGVFTRGNWSDDGDLVCHENKGGKRVPFEAPGFLLNPLSLKAFNIAYGAAQQLKPSPARGHYASAFYPLDAIQDWNKLYGGRGLYQYQSVVPSQTARDATAAMLDAIARAGDGSMLAVLKTFGDRPSPGLLSFPKPGVTLALDFQNRGEATLALLARLDAIVSEAGGRLYPAKDGRMPAKMFQSGYPAWEAFASHVDPRFSSAFWRRVTKA